MMKASLVLLSLLAPALAEITFLFENSTVIRPFSGSPPERRDMALRLGGNCTATGGAPVFFGDRRLDLGSDLCLGAGAPVWDHFSHVRIARDRVSFSGSPPDPLPELALPPCEDAIADALCAYHTPSGHRVRLFSGNETLFAPAGVAWGQIDPGYDLGFVEDVREGPQIVLPAPPGHVLHVVRDAGGARRVYLEPMGDVDGAAMTAAVVLQVVLYVFVETAGVDLHEGVYLVATAAVVVLDPWLLRKLFVAPYWLREQRRAPLLLHALLTSLTYLQWGACTFSSLAIASFMFAQSTVHVVRKMGPGPVDAWIWAQCAFGCFVGAECWFDCAVTSSYGLSAAVCAAVWVGLILQYSVGSTSSSLIARRLRQVIEAT